MVSDGLCTLKHSVSLFQTLSLGLLAVFENISFVCQRWLCQVLCTPSDQKALSTVSSKDREMLFNPKLPSALVPAFCNSQMCKTSLN